jgi:hypothetical protein
MEIMKSSALNKVQRILLLISKNQLDWNFFRKINYRNGISLQWIDWWGVATGVVEYRPLYCSWHEFCIILNFQWSRWADFRDVGDSGPSVALWIASFRSYFGNTQAHLRLLSNECNVDSFCGTRSTHPKCTAFFCKSVSKL